MEPGIPSSPTTHRGFTQLSPASSERSTPSIQPAPCVERSTSRFPNSQLDLLPGRTRDRCRGRNRGRNRSGTRGNSRPIGVPGLTLCRIDHQASRRSPHNVIPGSPGRRAPSWFSRLRGRPPACHRCGRSPPRFPRATTPMVRRCDAGTPERPSVTEGRG